MQQDHVDDGHWRVDEDFLGERGIEVVNFDFKPDESLLGDGEEGRLDFSPTGGERLDVQDSGGVEGVEVVGEEGTDGDIGSVFVFFQVVGGVDEGVLGDRE